MGKNGHKVILCGGNLSSSPSERLIRFLCSGSGFTVFALCVICSDLGCEL